MTSDADNESRGANDVRRRDVSRAALVSYLAMAVSIGLWVTLVAVNRATSGEVNPRGEQADLLAIVLPVWTVFSGIAVLFALIALVRSRAKRAAVLALLGAVFVLGVSILQLLGL